MPLGIEMEHELSFVVMKALKFYCWEIKYSMFFPGWQSEDEYTVKKKVAEDKYTVKKKVDNPEKAYTEDYKYLPTKPR